MRRTYHGEFTKDILEHDFSEQVYIELLRVNIKSTKLQLEHWRRIGHEPCIDELKEVLHDLQKEHCEFLHAIYSRKRSNSKILDWLEDYNKKKDDD